MKNNEKLLQLETFPPPVNKRTSLTNLTGVSVKRQNVFWQTAFWQNVFWQTAIGQ